MTQGSEGIIRRVPTDAIAVVSDHASARPPTPAIGDEALREADFVEELRPLAGTGKLVFTIDRGEDSIGCFYAVNAMSASVVTFKEPRIIFWADDVAVWGDAAQQAKK